VRQKKRVRKNDPFVEPDVFSPGTVGGWGRWEIEEAAGVYAAAKIQELAERKMRPDKPELARAMATALENQKPFRSELPARWILAARSWQP